MCVQARVAGQGRHTHLRNNNGEVSNGVHPISAAAAAGRSASNDLSACSNMARTCHTLLTYATDRTPTI